MLVHSTFHFTFYFLLSTNHSRIALFILFFWYSSSYFWKDNHSKELFATYPYMPTGGYSRRQISPAMDWIGKEIPQLQLLWTTQGGFSKRRSFIPLPKEDSHLLNGELSRRDLPSPSFRALLYGELFDKGSPVLLPSFQLVQIGKALEHLQH